MAYLNGAVQCLRCSFFDRQVSESGNMPLPPFAVPVPIQLAGFLGVTPDDRPLEVVVSHQVFVDFYGDESSFKVYIPKKEIFPDRKVASRYLNHLTWYTGGRDANKLVIKYLEASQVVERLENKFSSLCVGALWRVNGVISSVECNIFDIYKLWENNSKGVKPVGNSRDNVVAALHELSKTFPDNFRQELSVVLAKFGMSLVPEKQASNVVHLDFPTLVRNTGEVFGLRDAEASEFAAARSAGKRKRINDSLVPIRKKDEARLEMLLPDGKPWDFYLINKNSSGCHNKTLQRVLFISANAEKNLVPLLKKQFPKDDWVDFGIDEKFGCSAVQLDDNKKPVQYVNAVKFFSSGFFAVTLHSTRIECNKTRQAIYSGQGSVFQALMEYSDKYDSGLQGDLIANMNRWRHLFDSIQKTFFVKQVSTTENAVLPTAFEVIKMMHSLCVDNKTPLTLLIRAVLGVSMCCGLRSGDFAKICVSTFKQLDSGNYITIRADDGLMVMTRTNSKTLSNGLMRIPLPVWLSEWLMEYELDGRPHLMGDKDHEFLFVTPSGLPLLYTNDLGDPVSRMPSVIAVMRQKLPMKDLTQITQLRSVFFNSLDECEGSILDLLGRADRLKRESASYDSDLSQLPLREEADRLMNLDETKKQLSFLNTSSEQQMDRHYSEKIRKNITQLLERFDYVKQYVFKILDGLDRSSCA
jgi:hypothetical protein